jgi:hypothetical protein
MREAHIALPRELRNDQFTRRPRHPKPRKSPGISDQCEAAIAALSCASACEGVSVLSSIEISSIEPVKETLFFAAR